MKQCPNFTNIRKIYNNFRYCIAEYIKIKYKRRKIGGDPYTNRTITNNETIIINEHGEQL